MQRLRSKALCLLVGWLGLTEARAQDSLRLRLNFVGDIMQHDAQIASGWDAARQTYDFSSVFRWVRPWLQSADVTIGNLELTLAGPPYKGYPQFSSPDALAFALKENGFDFLVTANNHSLDRHRKGLLRTLRVLDSARLPHTGTFADAAQRASRYPAVLEKNGFRLVLLNYTYGTNGIPTPAPTVVNLIDTAAMHQDLARARALNPDAVIVLLHMGDEYKRAPNAFQKRMAAFCFARGATLVIGAHPHVLQPMEWNRAANQLVAWSLGNFMSNMRERYRNGGVVLTVDLVKSTAHSGTARIAHASYQLVYVHVDEQQKFALVPGARDTLLRTQPAADALQQQFLSDSRSLLNTQNKHIGESQEGVVYALRLGPYGDSRFGPPPLPLFRHKSTEGEVWMAGPYRSLAEVQQVQADLAAAGVENTEVELLIRSFIELRTPRPAKTGGP